MYSRDSANVLSTKSGARCTSAPCNKGPLVKPAADTEITPQKKRRLQEPSSTNSKCATEDISTPLPPAAAIILAQSCRKSPRPLMGCPEEGDGTQGVLDTPEQVPVAQQPHERVSAREDESRLRAAAGDKVRELYDFIGQRCAETGLPEYRPHSVDEINMYRHGFQSADYYCLHKECKSTFIAWCLISVCLWEVRYRRVLVYRRRVLAQCSCGQFSYQRLHRLQFQFPVREWSRYNRMKYFQNHPERLSLGDYGLLSLRPHILLPALSESFGDVQAR